MKKSSTYLDERWKMPEIVDRKKEVAKMKKILSKKKIPVYVKQFGVDTPNYQ